MSELVTPVGISQNEWEFGCLLDLYVRRQPVRVLEVGTYLGGTFYHWLRNARPGTHVVSVDFYTEADNRELYEGWCPPDVTWSTVVGNSNDRLVAHHVATHAPFDWLFIDAGHLEENIRADVDLYLPLAATGSVVAFHDIREISGLPNVQVWRVWNELRYGYRSSEFVAPGGLGIGVLFL